MKRLLSVIWWSGFVAVAAGIAVSLLPACGLGSPVGLPILWNFCPVAPASLSAEARREGHLRLELGRLERELASKHLACAALPLPEPVELALPTEPSSGRPQQTAAQRPPPPPPPPLPSPQPPLPPERVDLDAERWNNKDLSLLEGCWRLGNDVPVDLRGFDGTVLETNCTQSAGRLCFDGRGNGTYQESGHCPSGQVFDCLSPMSAHFAADGSLASHVPRNACNHEKTLACLRIDNTRASCTRQDRFGHSPPLQFYR